MKLTAQLKLLPSAEQARALRATLEMANKAANRLSQLAWDSKEFNRFGLQKAHYRLLRDEFPLSAQVVIRLLAKVADAYKLDKKVQREFRALGSISYDCRILALKVPESLVSIWTVEGRAKMPFVCGEKQRALLAYPHGDADLIFRKGKWFLNVTVDVPDEKEIEAVDVLGVDMGIVEIAFDSDGRNYSGSTLNKIRNRNRSLRKKLQKKGTKAAKRLLSKRNKRESRFSRDTNHCISKSIVQTAKRTNRAVAIEDLSGIRSRVRARKRERTRLHSWAFAELGGFLAYKCERAGIPLLEYKAGWYGKEIRVADRFFPSSKRCHCCGFVNTAVVLGVEEWDCPECKVHHDRDDNASHNILKFAKATSPTAAGQAEDGRGGHVRPKRTSVRSGNVLRSVNQPGSANV